MNWPFAIAGFLTVIVAAVHSFLGERWVFSRIRQLSIVPTNGGNILREPHVRILWATWHVVSVLGLAISACLFLLAVAPVPRQVVQFVGVAVAVGMFASSALVFIGTRARHVGWVGLLAVSVLSVWGLLW